MAYEKQTWQSGDIITAEKLNHIENGLEAIGADSVGKVIVIGTAQDGSSDSTEKEWHSQITTDLSMLQGRRPLYVFPVIRADEGGYAQAGSIATNNLYVHAGSGLGQFDLVADYDDANYFEGSKTITFDGKWKPLGAGGYTLTLYAVVLA